MRPRPVLAGLVVCGSAVLLAAAVQGQADGAFQATGSSAAACSRIELWPPPGWTNSGAWNGEHLLLVDTQNQEVLRYSATGRQLGTLGESVTRSLKNTFPTKLAAQGQRLVIQVQGDRFLSLDRSYVFHGATDAHERVDYEQSAVRKLLTWALAGSDVFGFAEVESPGNRWSSGLVRFSLDQPGAFKYLAPRAVTAVSRKFHRLGYPYVAAAGGTGYAVLMEGGQMTLYRSAAGSGQLDKMDALDDVAAPELPSFVQPEDFVSVMQAVEESAMVAGIYTQGADLYVLFRRPAGGATEWRLSHVNLATGRIDETTKLPSRAHHLFAVPGDKRWAFIEKGPARTLNDQDVTGAFLVPASRLQGHLPASLCQ